MWKASSPLASPHWAILFSSSEVKIVKFGVDPSSPSSMHSHTGVRPGNKILFPHKWHHPLCMVLSLKFFSARHYISETSLILFKNFIYSLYHPLALPLLMEIWGIPRKIANHSLLLLSKKCSRRVLISCWGLLLLFSNLYNQCHSHFLEWGIQSVLFW